MYIHIYMSTRMCVFRKKVYWHILFVYCSPLSVAVCGSVLQSPAACRNVLQYLGAAVCCRGLQRIEVCCSMLRCLHAEFAQLANCLTPPPVCVAVRCSTLQRLAVCCSVLQRVAACNSV